MSTVAARIFAELRGDRVIWAILVLLAIFSILAVYSSTGTLAYREHGGNTEGFLIKHGIIMMGGLVLAYITHLIPHDKFRKWASALLGIAAPLLIYTLAFGTDINNAKRWIQLPMVGITIQTSAFAKVALIVFVAAAISGKQDYIKDFKSAFLPIIVPILIICGLIAPADLSSALLLFLTCLLMMFVGRVALKYIGVLLFWGVIVFAVLILLGKQFPDIVRSGTWQNRMEEFMTQEDGGYQVKQAKIAIANGGIVGLGPGNSRQRNYLPSPYSDFIYAIICEEYGLIGGMSIIFLYLLLFFRITRLMTKSDKTFGAMVAMGLGISLIIQAFTNIAVSIHLVPVTGVTLPMVSMGGTSLLFTAFAFGIILSVSKHVEANAE